MSEETKPPELSRLEGVVWQDDGAGWCVVEYPNGDLLAWDFDLGVGEWVDPPPYTEKAIWRAWAMAERARAEKAEAIAAAERALRVAVAGEGEVFERTQVSVRALLAGRDSAEGLSGAVDAAVAKLRALGVTP